MKNRFHTHPLIYCLALSAFFFSMPPALHAADQQAGATKGSILEQYEYKVISGFKQPFKDALQFETSKGWIPVGGVSVTSWNGDLYFAQLLSKSAGAT